MKRLLGLLAVAAAGATLVVTPAYGDAVYHSQHIALTPVGSAPLRTGFIENIHVNGPVVYAHEVYVLNGAEPGATYQVTLNIFVQQPTCPTTTTPLTLSTAQVVTNVAGNGTADAVFTPADAGPLRGATHGIVWTLSRGDTVVYTSGCEAVTLD